MLAGMATATIHQLGLGLTVCGHNNGSADASCIARIIIQRLVGGIQTDPHPVVVPGLVGGIQDAEKEILFLNNAGVTGSYEQL